MRPFLMILSGFTLTFGTFAAGAVTAALFIAAEPVRDESPGIDAAEVWTSGPVAVDPATQNYARLPARPVPKEVLVASASADVTGLPTTVAIDETFTHSIAPQVEENDPTLDPEHVEWCANRYRSYRPRDNSYTPYSGGRRECVSPYSRAAEVQDISPAPALDDRFGGEEYVEASYSEEGFVSPEHIESCFSRYRSYRAEDNTYQPYGGGPRKQCL